ncbi:MAG TPA: NAD-dependent epimerase/dehydratase family protein [Terriglobales bacterium]
MRAFVTGAAGFVGSNLVDRLLADGHQVTGLDNLSTGRIQFLESALRSAAFDFHQGDISDAELLCRLMAHADCVFHMAANADVRFGLKHPHLDVEQNTIGTFNVLEAMRITRTRRLAFASTGSIYGEPAVFPTPETAPFPIQTSLYGASKLAAEGLIMAYSEGFDIQSYIFRFVSILGERYTHGHVFDFYEQLCKHSGELHVLGDGTQRKSYLYVQDCIDGMLLALRQAHSRVNIFNLGTDDSCVVNDSIGWIIQHLGLSPKVTYGGGRRGWVGDSPFILLDCSKIRALGWKPLLTIREGVVRTLDYLQRSPEALTCQAQKPT